MIRLGREISFSQMEWRNDPEVSLWTRQNGLLSIAEMKRWREKIDTDPTIQMFGIHESSEERADFEVGTCGLTSISFIHGSAEFSLLIAPEFRRRGFAEAALLELLRYGFDHLRLWLIYGETFQKNPARHLFLKIGFKEEGLLRSRYFKNGKRLNTVSVSIKRKEFYARHLREHS